MVLLVDPEVDSVMEDSALVAQDPAPPLHKPRIVFGLALGEAAAPHSKPPNKLEEERERHRRRADKFHTEYVAPKITGELALEAKRERLQREPAFTTGIDLYTEVSGLGQQQAERQILISKPQLAPCHASCTMHAAPRTPRPVKCQLRHTQEEVNKRQQRASRFHISEPVLAPYGPDEAEEAKKKRAAKWGTTYVAPDAVLMDMGVWKVLDRGVGGSTGLLFERICGGWGRPSVDIDGTSPKPPPPPPPQPPFPSCPPPPAPSPPGSRAKP